jgi:uncharacterized membrane protein YdjX (TVP38/TMEM64 family)
MKKQSNWLTLLFLLAFLGLVGLAGWAYFSQYPELNSENLDRFIRGFGPQAMMVYGLAYLVSSPIPFLAPILTATGGLLFGPVWGTLLSILSAAATSLVPFMIARRLGREWVDAKLKGTRLDNLYQKANQGSGFIFVLLLRLVPLMPWELQNYVAGVTQVRVPTYLLATILGSAPLSIALVILGAAARDPTSWQFFAALALAGAVLLLPILIVVLRRKGMLK